MAFSAIAEFLVIISIIIIIVFVAWWCNFYSDGLAIERLPIRFSDVPASGNDSGQVVHTHVPLSPSSTIWYRPKRREGNGSMWERCGLPPT